MSSITIAFGVLLIALGLIGFVSTGSTHHTALIPAYAGLVLIVLGILARKDSFRKHAMHAAVMVGLLGFLGNLTALPACFTLITGGSIEHPAAPIARGIKALSCAIYVGLCVRSFIQARKARLAQHA